MAASQTTTLEQPATEPLLGRHRLARMVVVGSFLTLFLLAGALIGLSDNKEASEAAKSAFGAILPVLAGWVGTVLAFYFSAASQERASASLDRVISQTGLMGPAAGKPIAEKMIPLSAIEQLQELKEGNRPQDIKLEKLEATFDKTLPNGAKVTRLLFVESGVFKYILHVSTFNAFMVKAAKPEGLDAARGRPFTALLADEEALRQISKLVVFVSATATLVDAKAALDNVAGAQDIIVTGSGSATEPMLGWLSNVDLIKALTA